MTPADSARLVVLVRHGEAVSEAQDPARSLSAGGRAHAVQTGGWLAALGLGLDEVHHSGRLRAQQTADIVAASLGLTPDRVRAVAGLGPNDDVEPVALELEVEQGRMALVGHLPFLARLASRLLVGDPGRLQLRFPDAAAMILARSAAGWQLVALVSHELLPGSALAALGERDLHG